MRRKLALATLAIVTLVILMLIWAINRPDQLDANGHKYYLLVAKTTAAQAKGLGDRASMPANQGMLFVFSGEAPRCFWMKDMHFSLDMIWLNHTKTVVAMQNNVSPATYPHIFCPDQPAEYVIELLAGQAKAAGVKQGQQLSF